MPLQPIEFACDQTVSIRRSPHFVREDNYLDVFWYLRKPVYTRHDHPQAHMLRSKGFDVLYWSGEEWRAHTPKQFASPEQAMDEFRLKLQD